MTKLKRQKPGNPESRLLVVATSPRRNGNCDAAARVLCQALGGSTAVALHDFKLERCQGCLKCQQGRRCGITDDFNRLWRQVAAASTVVFVVPVYWCAPPGLFKDFIDRSVAFFGSEPMKGKTFHLVSIAQSAGFDPLEQIIDTWIRWLGGRPLKSRLRLIAFHRGDLLKNASAVRKLHRFGVTLRRARPAVFCE